jgi:hypothetical protein
MDEWMGDEGRQLTLNGSWTMSIIEPPTDRRCVGEEVEMRNFFRDVRYSAPLRAEIFFTWK